MKIKLSATKTLVIEIEDTSEPKAVREIKALVKKHIIDNLRIGYADNIKILGIKFLRRGEISRIFIDNNLVPESEIYSETMVSLSFAKEWLENHFPPEFFAIKK